MSSAAVLSGEELKIIKTRYHGRIVGSIVGLLIGAGLTLLNLSIVEIVLVLMLLNILVEYFMPRNYALANFFTNL
ncbi:FUSC family protein [Lactococcus fujiensis]|uniref:FUSC family protein n=1 Tax=Lactococcus fujiensis TaxID=610251 RepID=UPI003571458D